MRRIFLSASLSLAIAIPVTANATEAPELTQNQFMEITALTGKQSSRELIEYLEKHIGQNEPTANQLFYLCMAYYSAGRFGKMSACFDMEQHKSPDGRVLIRSFEGATVVDLTTSAYGFMARGYERIGEYDKAIAAGKRALVSIGELATIQAKTQVVQALGQLGTIYAKQGDHVKAEEIAQRLRNFDMNGPGVNEVAATMETATINMWLAEIYMASKNYIKALEAYDAFDKAQVQWAAQQNQSAALKEIIERGEAVRSAQRASILVELDRQIEALALYDRAFAYPRFQRSANLYWGALFNYGRLKEKNGQTIEAIRFYMTAVDEIEKQRASINSEASKIGFVGDKQEVYLHLIKALIKAKRPGDAFEYAERAKARALIDMLASREKFERPQGTEAGEVNALLPTPTQLNTDMATFKPGNATPEQLQKHQMTRALARKTAEQLQKADFELASLVTVTGVSEASLRALLQPDETLVEYYYLGDDLYAFVATKSAVRALPLKGAGLADAVRDFRTAIHDAKSKDTTQLARELYGRLLAPLGLPANGKLLVVPHGVLHYLPFNALSNGKDSIIDHYSLRLLPSASVMSFLNQRKPSGKGIIIFGNPDLGDTQYDLPGAQKEAEEIARLRPDSTVLMRADATKTAAKKLAGNFAYLHFASHGKFDPSDPLQSGIYLANDKDTGTSGTLTVDELYSLNLNADLVTLSACETGLGRINNGDDLVGLTRGFFYAGVSSIISSLWEVDDKATYLMMTRFYGELDKAPKAEALRKAQLAVKAKYPHPYYWASFQLTGNRI
jgi:CHAT domain-containing protein